MDEQKRIEAGVRVGARSKRRPSAGGGVVPRRDAVVVGRVERLTAAAGGAARAHVVDAPAPGDAVNAHADTDHVPVHLGEGTGLPAIDLLNQLVGQLTRVGWFVMVDTVNSTLHPGFVTPRAGKTLIGVYGPLVAR